ncbi:acetyl-CoA synthetase-like protein [Armillaria gallica]|uniref:Acetyl-CoA synthetase-like protein n=1 Tax=Armillaria gallica TaxID=47427 RepID=A0A2H3EA08_ARMGA|nr:acetyl-CoA synthetase-like protein [Armillaria gallica]
MADVETWTPRCSIDEADRLLTGPGSLLEVETRIIDGRVLKVWKNLWPSLRHLFLQSTKEHADKIYVVYEKERHTFREMLEQSRKCAAMLRDLYGVEKGDRVAICSRHCPNYLVVFWACHLLGAVTALVNMLLPLEPLRHCITLTKCKLIILDPERADVVEPIGAELKFASGASGYLVLEDHEGKGHWESMDVWSSVFSGYNRDPGDMLSHDPQILPEDDAAITFTSGTTSLPKGVLSSQRALLTPVFNVGSLIGRDCLRRGEPFVPTPSAGPQEGLLIPRILSQPSSIIPAIMSTLQGDKVVLTRAWNIDEGKMCKTENITQLNGMPSMIREFAESTISRTSITRIMYGGTPVAASHLQRFKEDFPLATIFQIYGLTETNAGAAGFGGPDYDARPDSCGLVFPVSEILIMKDGVKVPPGAVGEIWVRGPNVMKGYYGDQAATDQVITKDGWLMTGDLGRMDEDGYVYITDRIKDIIIRDGYNVDSIFVENALYTEPGILETAVVGVADEQAGELPVALVTLKPEYDGLINEEKLMAAAEKLLPEFAVPVMIIMHDRGFDHTLASGKIIKAPLRVIAQREWVRRTMKE